MSAFDGNHTLLCNYYHILVLALGKMHTNTTFNFGLLHSDKSRDTCFIHFSFLTYFDSCNIPNFVGEMHQERGNTHTKPCSFIFHFQGSGCEHVFNWHVGCPGFCSSH